MSLTRAHVNMSAKTDRRTLWWQQNCSPMKQQKYQQKQSFLNKTMPNEIISNDMRTDPMLSEWNEEHKNRFTLAAEFFMIVCCFFVHLINSADFLDSTNIITLPSYEQFNVSSISISISDPISSYCTMPCDTLCWIETNQFNFINWLWLNLIINLIAHLLLKFRISSQIID